jgi:hypothetical protein
LPAARFGEAAAIRGAIVRSLTVAAESRRVVARTLGPDDQKEQDMVSPTDLGHAGLQGWRKKTAEVVAGPISARTPAREEHVRAVVGATFFVLAVSYVVKTGLAALKEVRGSE